MKNRALRSPHLLMRTGIALAFLLPAISLNAACGQSEQGADEGHVHSHASPLFVNGDFENGAAGVLPPSWNASTYINSGITFPPQSVTDLKLQPGGSPKTVTLESLAGPESQPDSQLGAGVSFRWPKFGNKTAIVNSLGANNNVNGLKQTMTVAQGDIDPADNKPHIRFVVAPVLQSAGHGSSDQPYYYVQLRNVTTGTTIYRDFNAAAQPGVPWKTSNGNFYLDWSLVDVTSKPNATLAIGDQVELQVIASGCAFGGHFGHVYIDGIGSTIPGLFVSGAAPSGVLAGGSLVYTLSYKNGSTVPANGVKVDFNLPAGVTFASFNAPGLTCTVPAVGAAGVVSCTVPAAVAAGAGGSFTITTTVGAAAVDTLITAGDYSVSGTGLSPLIGNKLDTRVGCSLDSQCPSTKWCSISTATCTNKFDNGDPLPTDGPHVGPALTGACTADAATLVCKSTVCSTGDNRCGYLNSELCSTQSQCRSNKCDADGKCGVPTAGTCTVDADCRSNICVAATKKCDGDTDGDGVLDSVEIALGTNPSKIDSDGDGIPDNVELSASGSATGPYSGIDTDLDGTIDALDLDSDQDGVPDAQEFGASANTPVNSDGADQPDWRDTDDDNDTILTSKELADAIAAGFTEDVDTDAKKNWLDVDADNDGIADKDEPTDADRNGVPDYLESSKRDTDGDGIPDLIEVALGMNPKDADSDGDGIKDGVEIGGDPSNPVDTDKDGKIDALDTDDDNDGILTKTELGAGGAASPQDSDGDGIKDYLDADDDNDGVPTKDELGAGGAAAAQDTDSDGKVDYLDVDDDNDGVLTANELGAGGYRTAQDSDGDGKKDFLDVDDDGDGVLTKDELGAGGAAAALDTDGDGKKNYLDVDDDNDTLATKDELGTAGGASPVDSDGDGKPDYLDEDDDNDTILTKQEIADATAAKLSEDVDGDGKRNWLDLDSDNDKILDSLESGDRNGDQIADYLEIGGSGPVPVVDGALEGGGIACSTTGTSGGTSGAPLMALTAIATALLMRRKRTGGGAR
jgi:uncharacterized repeat protein (TIGR01451 family)